LKAADAVEAFRIPIRLSGQNGITTVPDNLADHAPTDPLPSFDLLDSYVLDLASSLGLLLYANNSEWSTLVPQHIGTN
jgi:hypothetical protein